VRAPIWALAALLAAGCVVIPIPRRDPTLPAARWLGAGDGALSREDVLLHLGEPDFAGDAEKVIIYRWHLVRALVFVSGYTTGAFGEVDKEHDLVLRFDPAGRLVSQEVAAGFEFGVLAQNVCTPSGICVGSGTPVSEHVVYEANAEPHAESNGSACSIVFLPSEVDPASIWADGRLLGFANYQGWLGASLTPGPHRVAVMSPPTQGQRQVEKELAFTCDAGARLYVVQNRIANSFFSYGDGSLGLQGEPLPSELRSRARRYLNVEPVPP
jgi:hypothetical protein